MAEANFSQSLRNAPGAPGTPAPGAPGQNQWFESFFNFKGASPIQLPPELLAKQLRGLRASQQLAGIEKEREALAKKQYKAPEGLGYDGVYQAANPVGHIGALMSGFANDQKSRDLAEQAKALRYQAGDDEAATAEMQFALGGQKGSDSLGWAKFMYDMQQDYLKRMDAQNKTTGDAERYVNKDTGEVMWLRPTESGFKNLATDDYMAMSGNIVPLNSNAVYDRIPEKLQTKAESYRVLYTNTKAVQEAAKNLTERDMKDLSQPGLFSLIKGLTPQKLDAYIMQNGLELSANAKAYLEKAAALDGMIRHSEYGAALTGAEIRNYDEYAIGSPSLDFKGRVRRLNSLMDKVLSRGRALVDSNDFKDSIYSDLGKFDFWTPDYKDEPEGNIYEKFKQALPDPVQDVLEKGTEKVQTYQSTEKWRKMIDEGDFEQLKSEMETQFGGLSPQDQGDKANELLDNMTEDEQEKWLNVFEIWLKK